MNGSVAINLGTGTGYSVLEMVNAYKDINKYSSFEILKKLKEIFYQTIK